MNRSDRLIRVHRAVRRLRVGLTLCWLVVASCVVGTHTAAAADATSAATATSTATSTANEVRLKALAEELRCLVCQNQTLADSQADLAVDLRNQVKAMIDKGDSDAQIKTYLVDRYGDFVLYKPPVQGNTWFLWAGPFVLLAVGAAVWWRIGRRRGRGSADTVPPGDTPAATIDQARKWLDD